MSKIPLLLEAPLDKTKKIAFVFSPQLGDSLIAMVVAYNLRRNGYNITVFSDYIFSMRHWFANDQICAYPKGEEVKSTLLTYDILIFTYPNDIIGQADLWHPNIVVLSRSLLFKAKKNIIDIQVDVCREELLLVNLVRINDLTPPKGLLHHKYLNRVIIHPTSRQGFRSWHKDKFVKLAKELHKLGLAPTFIVSPAEQQEWLSVSKEGLVVLSIPSLDKVAAYIYESGWFIGNDSGLGHLASNLGLHTVTLAVRPSVARMWRPNWMPGAIVLPPSWLISRQLKERFWKNFISVRKVLKICKRQSWANL